MKVVDRRQRGEAERLRLAGRIEQMDQRRQHGHAGGEGDQHAEAGDQSEFRHALVFGRQEGQETRGGGEARQRQRRADKRRRRAEIALIEIVDLMTLGAIANAELDAEIDADADEQHGEIDRNEIEGADHEPDRAAAVSARPTMRLMMTAPMSLHDCNASHRISSTMAPVMMPLRVAFSLIVPNSSSAMATGPVRRRRA